MGYVLSDQWIICIIFNGNKDNRLQYMKHMSQLRVKGEQKREVEGELRPHTHVSDLRDGEGYKEDVEGDEIVARNTLATIEEETRWYPIATQ